MKLTSAILRDMADAIDKIAELDFEVGEIVVGGHKARLDKVNTGSSDKIIVGITNGDWSEKIHR